MKKLFLFFIVFIFGSMHPIYGGIDNSGTFNLINSTCWGDIVNNKMGVIEGKGSIFLGIVNYGTVNLDDCTIKAECKSFGQLNALNTSFQRNVIICDGQTILDSCKLENLFIKDDLEDTPSLPQVILQGSTTISGSIVFTTGQGRIYKGPNVVILGQVVNGSITNLNE